MQWPCCKSHEAEAVKQQPPARPWALPRLAGLVLSLLVLLASHLAPAMAAVASSDVSVVEQLRLNVPSDNRQAWLDAEQHSWEPWLAQQDGFLDRQLLWDPKREEGTLLIRWASREQWKAIPSSEVAAVQERFEQLARVATGQRQGNPFPLTFEGELLPQ